MVKYKYVAILIAVGVLPAAGIAKADIEYSVTDLGLTLNGTSYINSSTRSINNAGMVVGGMSGGPIVAGSSVTSSADGFYYNGALTDVGTLPHNIISPPNNTKFNTTATSINDNNVVTGVSQTDDSLPQGTAFGNQAHGFVYMPSTGTMTDIQANSTVWKATNPVYINNNNVIVGNGSLAVAQNGTTNSVFLYNVNTSTLNNIGLPTGITFGFVEGITDSGVVAFSNSSNTYLYDSNAATPAYNSGLNGMFGWSSSNSTAVSHNGLIVGSASVPISAATAHSPTVTVAGTYAFIYDTSTGNVSYIDTDTPAVFASGPNTFTSTAGWGINDEGEVVGTMKQTGQTSSVAMVFENGVATQLSTLLDPSLGLGIGSFTITGSITVNDSGVIAASGTGSQFLGTHALILTPTPEPAGLTLLAVGSLMLGRRRRKIVA